MSDKEFEDIFNRYYSDIYNFAYHYVMDPNDAEDLVQDVFILFFEKQNTLPCGINTKHYLLTMTKNHCISFLRHKKMIARRNSEYLEILIFSTTSEYDVAFDNLFIKLNQYMQILPNLQKQIVKMKLEGKTYSEISDELRVTHSYIHKNIQKAYAIIRFGTDKTIDH